MPTGDQPTTPRRINLTLTGADTDTVRQRTPTVHCRTPTVHQRAHLLYRPPYTVRTPKVQHTCCTPSVHQRYSTPAVHLRTPHGAGTDSRTPSVHRPWTSDRDTSVHRLVQFDQGQGHLRTPFGYYLFFIDLSPGLRLALSGQMVLAQRASHHLMPAKGPSATGSDVQPWTVPWLDCPAVPPCDMA